MEEKKGNSLSLCLKLTVRDAEGNITAEYENPYDLATKALAQQIQNNILDTAESIVDVTNTARALSANDAATAPYIVAGTTSTAAAFTDYALGDGTTNTDYKTNGNYAQSATINAISSNTFTVTATITNASGSSITYREIGLANTIATYQFLLAHDIPNGSTGYTVSNNGTLQVTYTATFT